MFTALTNIFTKFSFKNMFQPIVKRFLKIFFSDRRTASILRLLAGIFGGFRFLNACLGFLLFINLYDFKNIYSIPSSIITFFKLLKDNFNHALDKYFPQHPHLPKSVKSSINDAGKTLYHSLDDTPMADVVHKISDNVLQAEHVVEGRFTSLRKIYSNYVNSWFSPISQSTDNYNILTDWKLYVGIIIFSGFCYFFMPWLYNSFFGSNKSMDNVRIHDDLDTPSRPLVSDIPD